MIKVGEAIDQAKIIKDMIKSPEFLAAKQAIKDITPDSTGDEKVEAVKGIIPFLLPIGEFAKAILGNKGDNTVDDITEILQSI